MSTIKPILSTNLRTKPSYLSILVMIMFGFSVHMPLLEAISRIIMLPFFYAFFGISSLDFSNIKIISIAFSVVLLILLWLLIKGSRVSIFIALVALLAIACIELGIAKVFAAFAMPCALFFIAEERIPTFKQWNLFKRLATLVATVPLGLVLGAIIIMLFRE